MSAGNTSVVDPLQPDLRSSGVRSVLLGRTGSESLHRACNAACSTPAESTPAPRTPLMFAQPRGVQSKGQRVSWLWRSTNLPTLAAGCGLALALHTADSYLFPDSLPVAIAGSAPHIFPPLCALLVSASLAVASERQERVRGLADQSMSDRLLLMTTAFAVAWTSIEWILRSLQLATNARQALPLEVLFTAVVVLFHGIACGRARQRLPWHAKGRDVLIVGTDAVARDVKEYLQTLPRSGYRFRGYISTAEAKDWSFAEHGEIAGHVDNLLGAARAMFVDEVILAAAPSLNKLEELCSLARRHQITLRFVPSMAEGLRRSAEVRYIGSLPTIVAYQRRRRPISQTMKRGLDLMLGTTALFLLSPVFLVVAIAIKLRSDGPVFYASERVGVRGRGFLCFKFRTMVRNADALRSSIAHLNERQEILFKISNDPRVTPLGAWLRKYSLDELPQLFNVLRGDMSLVGPRPSLRAEVLQYGTAHFRRLDVVPGMTGLWQVEARSDPSFESYVALDCQYADEWSLWLDFRILLRTLRVVILGTGV